VEIDTNDWKTAQLEEMESHANSAKELDTSQEHALIQEQANQKRKKNPVRKVKVRDSSDDDSSDFDEFANKLTIANTATMETRMTIQTWKVS